VVVVVVDGSQTLVQASSMQWTAELNVLLNQCAFSAGYDFAETCAALKPRATRLRIDRCGRVRRSNCLGGGMHGLNDVS
jgi:hypothetical protein